ILGLRHWKAPLSGGACAKDLVSRTRDGNDACRKGIHGVPQALPDSSENCRIQSIPLLGTVDRDACHPVFNRIQNLAHKLYLRRKISFWRADFTEIHFFTQRKLASRIQNGTLVCFLLASAF